MLLGEETITSVEFSEIMGISNSHLIAKMRFNKTEKELGFPKPIIINSKRFLWVKKDVLEYKKRREEFLKGEGISDKLKTCKAIEYLNISSVRFFKLKRFDNAFPKGFVEGNSCYYYLDDLKRYKKTLKVSDPKSETKEKIAKYNKERKDIHQEKKDQIKKNRLEVVNKLKKQIKGKDKEDSIVSFIKRTTLEMLDFCIRKNVYVYGLESIPAPSSQRSEETKRRQEKMGFY